MPNTTPLTLSQLDQAFIAAASHNPAEAPIQVHVTPVYIPQDLASGGAEPARWNGEVELQLGAPARPWVFRGRLMIADGEVPGLVGVTPETPDAKQTVWFALRGHFGVRVGVVSVDDSIERNGPTLLVGVELSSGLTP